MCYDYYGLGYSGGISLAHTGLYDQIPNDSNAFSTDTIITAILNLGFPASKISLGLAFYARIFTLAEPLANNGTFTALPIANTAPSGLYTRMEGYYSYFEIVNQMLSLPTTITTFDNTSKCMISIDPISKTIAYYDNPNTLAIKINYGRLRGINRYFSWCLQHDDTQRGYPLSTFVQQYLHGS